MLLFISRNVIRTLQQVIFYLTNSQKLTTALLSFLLYPGVVIHELSHLITAAVLLVPVKSFNLVPVQKEKTMVSGSVEIVRVDILRNTIVGIAPLFAGITVLWLITTYLLPPIPFLCNLTIRQYNNSAIQNVILCQKSNLHAPISQYLNILISLFLIFSISSTMYSSKKDLEALVYVVPTVVFFIGIGYILGFQFSWLALLVERLRGVFQTLSVMLLFPLGIQLAFFILLSFFRKR